MVLLPKMLADVIKPSAHRPGNRSESQSHNNSQPSSQHLHPSGKMKNVRDRSSSTKRKHTDSQPHQNYTSFANIVAGKQAQKNPIFSQHTVDAIELTLDKAKEMMAKLKLDIEQTDLDPAIASLLNGFGDILTVLRISQESIVAAMKDNTETAVAQEELNAYEGDNTSSASYLAGQFSSDMQVLGTFAKRTCVDSGNGRMARPTSNPTIYIDSAQPPLRTEQQEPADPLAAKRKKFREEVELAERSTLVINLNLGRTKVINPETISTNVTKALSAMAAKIEKEESGAPCDDTMAIIDDIFSVTKSMRLYGKATRSVRSAKDKSINGSYCTIPVCYEFSDRDTRFYAEDALRKHCGVQCSTPYHPTLREAIRQIIAQVKEIHGNCLVKVLVDTRRMVFKVSHRATKDGEWQRWPKTFDIPEECLDIDVRANLENVKISVPMSPPRQSRKDSHEAEMNSPEKSGGSGGEPGIGSGSDPGPTPDNGAG